MRLGYFGSPPISARLLEAILKSTDHTVACVVSNPDRPRGRSGTFIPTEVAQLALERDIPLFRFEKLKAEGIRARVVSMPSWEIFEYYCRKDPGYRETVLPSRVTARVSVEQASTIGWERYVGSTGRIIGMESFGASAPLKELTKKFGFTVEHVVAAAKAQLKK